MSKQANKKHDLVWWYDKLGLIAATGGLCLAIVAYGEKITDLFFGAIPIAAIGAFMVFDTFVHEKGWAK
jgi:hypothetical protein